MNHNEESKEYLKYYAKASSRPSYFDKFKVYGITEEELIKIVKTAAQHRQQTRPYTFCKKEK